MTTFTFLNSGSARICISLKKVSSSALNESDFTTLIMPPLIDIYVFILEYLFHGPWYYYTLNNNYS